MSKYSLTHLSDGVLLQNLAALVAQDCATTAAMLAHIAEVDDRRLYLPAGFPSMYLYCVQHLHLSEDAAYKRIQAARSARQFPAIFDSLAAGRLHLTAVGLLAPYLTPKSADELLAAAAHQPKSEIERLLAERFPRSEMLAMVQAIATTPPVPEERLAPFAGGLADASLADVKGFTGQLAPAQVEALVPRPRVTPLAPQRFALQLTIGQSTYDKLRYAQELLSHQIPGGDMAEILERALDALIGQLERRKYAATSRPRPSQHRSSENPRHIPASVKRAVWKRDGGQCAFVAEGGQRCPARARLEFDHEDPVARGGEATPENVRLRCRAHNGYAADCVFGAAFMSDKREEAQRARAQARARTAAAT